MDFSKTKPSKNVVDETGATPYNDLGKFLAALSFAIGIEEKLPTPREDAAENARFEREQQEYIRKWEESVKNLPRPSR